jgi:hypothetical protein
VFGQRGEHLVGVAADHARHRGRRDGAGRRHRPAALTDEDHGLLGRQHADAGGGGDLAHRVSGGHPDEGERVGRMREQLEGRQQPGGDQQRLRDGGVADRLGVRLGAVVRKVQTAYRGEPGGAGGEAGLTQPGLEETGGLRPLSGRHDGEHPFMVS